MQRQNGCWGHVTDLGNEDAFSLFVFPQVLKEFVSLSSSPPTTMDLLFWEAMMEMHTLKDLQKRRFYYFGSRIRSRTDRIGCDCIQRSVHFKSSSAS